MESYLPFRGYRTWYRSVGDIENGSYAPLIVVHGGPGDAHDYLLNLEQLSAQGIPLVFYDQLGCGNSDRPTDPDLWTFDLFLDELSALIEHLGQPRVNLLGHSWGGMLAMAQAVRSPEAIASLVLASSPASVPRISRDTRNMVAALPERFRAAIEHHERMGTTEHPEYTEAVAEFSHRHICRMDPFPRELAHDSPRFGAEVYATICGASEFSITGRSKDWDFSDRLGDIQSPTLITSGRFDEFTPDHAAFMEQAIPDARWVCFEESAHLPHVEEKDRYLDTVREFLRTHGMRNA